MESDPERLQLKDCPGEVQALVREIAREFQVSGEWPTNNDVHVMRVERCIDDGTFNLYRHPLLTNRPDKDGTGRLCLNLWALHDVGISNDIFAGALVLVGRAFEEIRRTRKAATITRSESASGLGWPADDTRLDQLSYIFERSNFSLQPSPEEGWKVVIDVARLSTSPPSIEALFLDRPLSTQYRPGNIMPSPVTVWSLEDGLRDDQGTFSNRIFIVHGSDSGLKSEVARTLERLGLEPVILHEQPNKGRTLVEKFEQYADVGFAVVILSPDDEGKRAGERRARPRARQNVVLELGFFWGKLGRHRVCALLKSEIERPSDYDGVVYVQYDEAGAWKLKLAKELKDAGYAVDLDRL